MNAPDPANPVEGINMPQRMCWGDGCTNRSHSVTGLCQTHLNNLRRYGDANKHRPGTSERFAAYIAHPDNKGCVLWTGQTNGDGYGRFWDSDKKRVVSVHRWVYEQHFGPIPVGAEICHTCDIPACVAIMHLFLGNHHLNMADMVAKGRHGTLWGERNGRAKLTTDDVRVIRALYAAGGWSYASLGRRFGVSYPTISDIVHRRGWPNAV